MFWNRKKGSGLLSLMEEATDEVNEQDLEEVKPVPVYTSVGTPLSEEDLGIIPSVEELVNPKNGELELLKKKYDDLYKKSSLEIQKKLANDLMESVNRRVFSILGYDLPLIEFSKRNVKEFDDDSINIYIEVRMWEQFKYRWAKENKAILEKKGYTVTVEPDYKNPSTYVVGYLDIAWEA